MTSFHAAWLAREQGRWLRNDAHRWLRPDHARFEKPQEIERKYNPNQPRVPAGNSDGGQWTSVGVHDFAVGLSQIGDALTLVSEDASQVILSDATDDGWIFGAQYAQNAGRGPYTGRGPILINGTWVQPTPAQSAILAAVEAQAQTAIRTVQDIVPGWRPPPSMYMTVDGRIAAARAELSLAQGRVAELQYYGALPGRFAVESFPARSPERDWRAYEIRENNINGQRFGCHTCGTREPGTNSGNYVPDHQKPNSLNPTGRPQLIFPHCATCSRRQGWWLGIYRWQSQ